MEIIINIAMFVLVCDTVIVHVGSTNSTRTASETLYYLSWSCHMDNQLVKGCAKRLNNVHHSGKCAVLCNTDDTCVGFSTDQNDNSCFHHKDCPEVYQFCRQPSTEYKYYNKRCYNNGRWIEKDNKCQCPTFMIGDMCETIPKSCAHIVSLGIFKGVQETDFILDPDGDGNLIQVKCMFPRGGYHVLDSKGFDNFNKTWQEYKYGFGSDINGYYWIGLETMYRVMKFMPGKFVLIMRLRFKRKEYVRRMYIKPKLSDETDGYKISFGSSFAQGKGNLSSEHRNTFGKCLKYVRNIPFSTWDKDNDLDSTQNCASDVGSGWWFSDCNAKCNVFGFYPTFPATLPPNQELRVEGVNRSMYELFKSSDPQSDEFPYSAMYLGHP